MAAEQEVLDKIRASITLQLGSTVQIRQEEGRNRTNVCEGVLQNAYPSVFTVLVNDDNPENPPQLRSFSYTDIITRDIRMKLC